MKGNKLFYAVVTLVLAILAIGISENIKKKSPSEGEKKFFPNLTESAISAITIKDSKDSVKIRRKGDIWLVEAYNTDSPSANLAIVADSGKPVQEKTYQADSASIVSAVEKLVKMEKGVLVSDNQAKQSIFEVDSSKGILVEVFDGTAKSAGSFRIGKNGADWTSNYVRMTGSNSVYMVSGSIRYSFFSDQKRWRDKTIMSFDKSTAKRISLVKKQGTSLSLAKADTGSGWNISEPVKTAAKVDQVDEILNTVANFKAADYDESEQNDSAMGFTNPELVVVIGFPDDASKQITFGSKNSDGKYRVRAEGKNHIFLINDYEFDKLNKDLEKLKNEESKEKTDSSKNKK